MKEKKQKKEEIIEEEKKSHKIINIFIFLIILLFLLFCYSKYIGIKGIITKEYRVESNILTRHFSGLKIVHFSDLLLKSTIEMKDVDELIEKINILNPDLIVFTGDLVNQGSKLSEEEKNNLINKLKSLKAKIGKYAVKGSADYTLDYFEEIMTQSDFTLLSNSYDTIYKDYNDPIYIVGLPPSQKETIDLEKSFEFYSEENRKYIIVLSHDGMTIEKLDKSSYEVDLILCGHSLGGSIILPYYGPLIKEKQSGNYFLPEYEKGITKIFVSSGIGTRKYNYRFLNKPSFNLYRLKSL